MYTKIESEISDKSIDNKCLESMYFEYPDLINETIGCEVEGSFWKQIYIGEPDHIEDLRVLVEGNEITHLLTKKALEGFENSLIEYARK